MVFTLGNCVGVIWAVVNKEVIPSRIVIAAVNQEVEVG
jgi:hypothetical protein